MYVLSLLSLILFNQEISLADTVDQPPKVLHAEPLYIDLIRDLGARKGEREWNIGMGMTDRLAYDSYEFLIEYEWAPLDRLGLELELPVTVYTGVEASPSPTEYNADTEGFVAAPKPSDRIESIKMAAQYTFLVSERHQTSLAIGGITELELVDLDRFGPGSVFQGIQFNPFLIAAKQWNYHLHTLLYTGPRIGTHFDKPGTELSYEINSNFHYMIPGTRNFVGIEFNKQIAEGEFEMVVRPQMRLVISDSLMVGIVPGIPVSKERERLSAFIRLIYEPSHRHASY